MTRRPRAEVLLHTPGSISGVTVLIVASLVFAAYTSNFADYSRTYGSIGAVIVLMFWLYIAGLVILLGSEINDLLEDLCRGEKKGRSHFVCEYHQEAKIP
jgi:membrane protein